MINESPVAALLHCFYSENVLIVSEMYPKFSIDGAFKGCS